MAHIVIDARIISSTTGRYVERLLHHLEQLDAENNYTVLVRKKDATYWTPANPNFTMQVADFKNYSFEEQLGLQRIIAQLKPDLVHFCTPEQPVLHRGKKITTIHDLTLLQTYNPDKNWLVYHAKQLVGQFVFRYVARSSRFVITPTDFVRDQVIKTLGASPEKVMRTYEAAEAVAPGSEPFPLPSQAFIMAVGQQSAYKNIVRLAESHQLLLKKHPDLQLVLVGKIDAAAEQNKATFKKRGYRNIVFTGFVSDEQLNWLYQHALAYIFPSLSEGFGLPGLEAMLQGAPVVSSNATCLPEVYGEAAEYFTPTDVESMRGAIERVIGNPARRDELIERGNDQVQKYSWQKMAEQTLELYKKALD